MNIKTQVIRKIERVYKLTSKEIKDKLDLEGEIISMNLYSGRSPDDIADGISPDTDVWEINTLEELKVPENKK